MTVALSEPIEFGEDPTALYRLYDRDGDLLYVGITRAPGPRMAQLAAVQPWWGEVTPRPWSGIRRVSTPARRKPAPSEKNSPSTTWL
jgi:hypothetical protein